MNFNLYLFRSTAENSQRVILTQVIFGVLSIIYFLLTQQYIYFLYAIILYFTIGEFLQNVALHRYFAHNSFTTNKFWHSFMAIFSPLACAGSPLAYSLAHRTHHLYSDTEKDPSYTKMGFLKVAFFRWNLEHVPSNVLRSLQRDKWVMFSHNYYVLILIVFWLILFSINFKLALVFNVTGLFIFLAYCLVNIGNHSKLPFSYRNYETKDNSRNDIITGYLYGEWHNNHHRYPTRWNQKEKWWELDIPAQIIKLIKK